MNTYTQILYQVVFAPKNREHILNFQNHEELYKYIAGILKNKHCHLYSIGGTSDHIHIIVHIHPTVALANLVKDIKVASSEFIRKHNLFSSFSGWQDGYGAFTYSIDAKDKLIDYVKNQEEHHKVKSFRTELMELLNEHNIEFVEKYLL